MPGDPAQNEIIPMTRQIPLSHVAVLLSGTILASPSAAQEAGGSNPYTLLGRIILTSTAGERPVAAVPGAVQVIEAEEIAEAVAQGLDVTAILARNVPGFSVPNQTLSGASETFRGRGLLVMVDGVPRNVPLRDTQRNLPGIDLAAVERIEVIGGASSLYGAGGTGGIVNFVTRDGTGDDGRTRITTEMRARAFTADPGASIAPAGAFSVSQRLGAFDYAFSLSHDRTRETFDGDGNLMPSDPMLGQGGGDDLSQTNITLRLGYQIDGARRLEGSIQGVRLEQNPRYFTDYSTDPVTPDLTRPYTGLPVAERSNYFTLRYSDEGFALGRLNVTLAHNDISRRFAFNLMDPVVNTLVYYSGDPDNPTAAFNQSQVESQRTTLRFDIQSQAELAGQALDINWGLELGRDDTRQRAIDGRDIATPLRNDTAAAFVQVTAPVGDAVTLSGGLRYDYHDLTVGDFIRPAAYYYLAPYRTGVVLDEILVTGGRFRYGQLTGNLGFTWQMSPATQAFGGFSQGFSLTDIGGFTRRAGMNSRAEACEAYGTSNPIVALLYGCTKPGTGRISYADIAPSPQVVNTWELGLRHDGARWSAQAATFFSTSNEGVSFDPVTNRVSQAREEIWGIELQGRYQISDATLFEGLLGYREGRVDTTGDGRVDDWVDNNRIGAPLRLRLGVTHLTRSGWALTGEALYMHGRERRADRIVLPSATLFNVSASRPLGDGTLSIAVENLLDRQYLNPSATATRNAAVAGLGRTITIGYTRTF